MSYHNMVQASEAACCPECGRPVAGKPKHGFAVLANTVEIDGQFIRMSLKVCGMLRHLARMPGETIHREAILRAMYGDADIDPKILDVLICHARKKLDGTRVSIETEYGIGYRLMIAPTVLTTETTRKANT